MSWSTALREPVPVPGGRNLKTLREVGDYVLRLPDAERESEAWHAVAENLMQAAEHGGLWLDFARMATMNALKPDEKPKAETPFNKRRKRIVAHARPAGKSGG